MNNRIAVKPRLPSRSGQSHEQSNPKFVLRANRRWAILLFQDLAVIPILLMVSVLGRESSGPVLQGKLPNRARGDAWRFGKHRGGLHQANASVGFSAS